MEDTLVNLEFGLFGKTYISTELRTKEGKTMQNFTPKVHDVVGVKWYGSHVQFNHDKLESKN